jgi:hypothetical protein
MQPPRTRLESAIDKVLSDYKIMKFDRVSKNSMMEHYKENRMVDEISRKKYTEFVKEMKELNPDFDEDLMYYFFVDFDGVKVRVHYSNTSLACEVDGEYLNIHSEKMKCAEKVGEVLRRLMADFANEDVNKRNDYLKEINQIKKDYKCDKKYESETRKRVKANMSLCRFLYGKNIK